MIFSIISKTSRSYIFYFFIKLWNVNQLSWIIKRIHYNFDEKFVDLIEELFYVVFSLVIFMQDEEFCIAWGLHTAYKKIIVFVYCFHIHVCLHQISTRRSLPLPCLQHIHTCIQHKIKQMLRRHQTSKWILLIQSVLLLILLTFRKVFRINFYQGIKLSHIDGDIVLGYNHEHFK